MPVPFLCAFDVALYVERSGILVNSVVPFFENEGLKNEKKNIKAQETSLTTRKTMEMKHPSAEILND